MTKTVLRAAALGVLLLPLAACDEQRAFGDADSIIVGARTELWNQVRDTVQAILEPKIQTVRRERTFTLTHQDPTGEAWGRLRLFRQELLMGSPEDPWVAEALEHREGSEPLSPPQIVQVHDVWARQQLVTILVLTPDGGAEDVISLLEPLHELMDRQFREYAMGRMFVSGRDTDLADSLQQTLSFSLLLPEVYRMVSRDSVHIFRNDNPDPSELIREITVSWRTPIPGEMPPVDTLLAWRQRRAETYYAYPQVNDTSLIQVTDTAFRGHPAREVQAVWSNPPGDAFPAGGPFILRAIRCEDDDRLYVLDAWLYAPNREKYEYMIQLETILDSFRCA